MSRVAATPLDKLLSQLGNCVKFLDIETCAIRYGLASGLVLAYGMAPLAGLVVKKSSLQDGKHVHDKLEQRFLKYNGPRSELAHDLIIERKAFFRPGIETPLESATKYRPGESIYPWVAQAFRTQGPSRGGDLRSDMIDVDRMQLWEVKAFNSIDRAVLQVANYTTRYNCVSQIPLRRYRGVRRPLTGGFELDSRILSPFALPISEAGRARLVIPVEIPIIPGVLSYLIVNLPKPEEMAAAAVADAVRRLIRELRRRRWSAGGSGDEQIPVWLLYLGVAIGVALLGSAAAGAPGAGLVAGLGGATIRGAQLLSRLVAAAGVLGTGLAAAQPPASQAEPVIAPVGLDEISLRTAFGTVPATRPDEAAAALALLAGLFTSFTAAADE